MNPKGALDYQISDKPLRIKPWECVNYQCVISHQFVIQYGMPESVPDNVCRQALVDPQLFFSWPPPSGMVRAVSHKYIRITPSVKSGSAFDLVNGITIDPETWRQRVRNYRNPVAPHLPTAQEFLRISMEAKIQAPATGRTGRVRWDQIGLADKSSAWECSECNMPNGGERLSCWCCRENLEFDASEEDPLGNESLQRAIEESFSHVPNDPHEDCYRSVSPL